jgi:ABC-type lipoprotein release transport system permease subunit
MVFGVSSQNPGMMLAAATAVIAIAGLAASVPLWRATRTDAVSNLRDG